MKSWDIRFSEASDPPYRRQILNYVVARLIAIAVPDFFDVRKRRHGRNMEYQFRAEIKAQAS